MSPFAENVMRRLWLRRHEHPFMRAMLRQTIRDYRLWRRLMSDTGKEKSD